MRNHQRFITDHDHGDQHTTNKPLPRENADECTNTHPPHAQVDQHGLFRTSRDKKNKPMQNPINCGRDTGDECKNKNLQEREYDDECTNTHTQLRSKL